MEGFTTNVDYYMALSDFLIGKPGPGCISEALQFHLPSSSSATCHHAARALQH